MKKQNWFVGFILYVYQSKRLRSFIWRAVMMALAGFLTVFIGVLDQFVSDVPQESYQVVAILGFAGLVLGEISKALNNKYGK